MSRKGIAAVFFSVELLALVPNLASEPKTAADKIAQSIAETEPVMVCLTDRQPPSTAEWSALCAEPQRGALLGSVADFKSRTIAFMNTRYLTANAAEGTLASYGKMGADKRYDRYGQIEGVEFAVDQNSWKERYVLNAAALAKLAGSRFLEYAGIGLDAGLDKNRQIDVTFIGTTVPKDEVIRRLNGNLEAIEYLDAIQQKRVAYDKEKFKLLTGAPPTPKVVLANVVMLNGTFSQALDASADGKLHSKVLSDGIELSVKLKNGEQLTLQSPIVRCYRTYSVEFKTDASGQPLRKTMIDKEGKSHAVPQVFDLTPDI